MAEAFPDTAPHLTCPRCYAVFLNRFPSCPLDGTQLIEMDEDLLIGKVIADRYLIEAFVGEGGMGRVYKARHTALSRRFAIKVLFGEYAAEEKARARFAREAEAASRLNHPNVVSVIDYGETVTRLPYLAMDFVEGYDLLTILDRERRLPLARVLRLAKDMCRGLAHAHARGLVHRDFKPGNVLVVNDHGHEVPRIADFGLAIDPSELSSRLTTGRIIFGSPAYMSPEQASQGELDARSDQFSLGVTLFELLTGRLPFGGSAIDQLTQNASAPRPAFTTADPTLQMPKRVERLVHKLMAIWPEGRFTGMDAVIAELEQIEGELATSAATSTDRNEMPAHMAARAAGVMTEQHDAAPSIPMEAIAPPLTEQVVPVPRPPQQPPMASNDPNMVLTQLMPPSEEPKRDRRPLWIALAVLALLALSVGTYVATRGEKAPARADLSGITLPSPDAAPVEVTAIEVDAAPVTEVVVPDAAVPAPVPAKDRGKKPVVKPKQPVATAPTPKPPDPTPVPPPKPPDATVAPPDGEITAKSFTDYYRQVGNALEKLRQVKGEDAAAPFRKRYFAIPLNDALRTPALRADAVKKLTSLERDIRSALAR